MKKIIIKLVKYLYINIEMLKCPFCRVNIKNSIKLFSYSSIECSICLDYSENNIVIDPCGHVICKNCGIYYLNIPITEIKPLEIQNMEKIRKVILFGIIISNFSIFIIYNTKKIYYFLLLIIIYLSIIKIWNDIKIPFYKLVDKINTLFILFINIYKMEFLYQNIYYFVILFLLKFIILTKIINIYI